MKKNKFYAVRNGRIVGVFLDWNNCKNSVEGFKNAEYKSFENPYDAIDYLLYDSINNNVDNIRGDYLTLENDRSENKKNDTEEKNQYIEEKYENDANFDAFEAYVDGSFDSTNKIYGSGVVIIYKDKVIKKISKKGKKKENTSMRNVAGEIDATMLAIKYCNDLGCNNLKIYYDYMGIEKWCSGEWKANKPGTIYYKNFFDKYSKLMNISFQKVKAHSGNKYNEMADLLAKEAVSKK